MFITIILHSINIILIITSINFIQKMHFHYLSHMVIIIYYQYQLYQHHHDYHHYIHILSSYLVLSGCPSDPQISFFIYWRFSGCPSDPQNQFMRINCNGLLLGCFDASGWAD